MLIGYLPAASVVAVRASASTKWFPAENQTEIFETDSKLDIGTFEMGIGNVGKWDCLIIWSFGEGGGLLEDALKMGGGLMVRVDGRHSWFGVLDVVVTDNEEQMTSSMTCTLWWDVIRQNNEEYLNNEQLRWRRRLLGQSTKQRTIKFD